MGLKLFFQRVALRIKGFTPSFEAGLLEPACGFEDYRHEDGRSATIISVGRRGASVIAYDAPCPNKSVK